MYDLDVEVARNYFTIRFWGAFAAVKYGAPHINEGGSINLTRSSVLMVEQYWYKSSPATLLPGNLKKQPPL